MPEGRCGAREAGSRPTPGPNRKRPFTADGRLFRLFRLFRLAAEAERIRLAHLFDPYLAVHASHIEALPHQITAVYGEMLPRQPRGERDVQSARAARAGGGAAMKPYMDTESCT